MRKTVQGVTLIDLIVVIAILTVLLSMASPAGNWLAKQQLRTTHSEIFTSINYARSLALSTGRQVTVCALHRQSKCQNPWHGDLTIFIDPTGALGLNESTQIRKVVNIPETVQVQWRGMNPNHSIRFAPTGLTFVSNGTFTLSHAALEETKKIIINRQGRARME